MPPVGLAIGDVDFTSLFVVLKNGIPTPPYATLADAQAAGAVTLNYGTFINTIIVFIIVALAVFLIVRIFVKARKLSEAKQEAAKPEAPTTKDCPFCYSKIHLNAKRCPNCTSQLE
jgi:large conductance mechanosensitive channel